MANGEWVRVTGNEIMGKKIAIIGLGRIGKEVAIRAHAFGMKIVGFDLIGMKILHKSMKSKDVSQPRQP